MDYDGANQHAVTHLGSISLSPRVSPDGSRIAFSSLTKSGWDILMYSLDLNRLVAFPRFGGTNLSPAWSSDGTKLAFSSSRSGDPEIYVVDSSGANLSALLRLKVRMFLRHGIARPAHKSPGSAAAPDCRRFTPWNRTAPTYSASPIRATRCLRRGRPMGNFWWFPGCASMDPALPGAAGHLHHGHRQQAVGAVDSRWRPERFPVLVSRWTAHHFSVQPGW